MLVAMTMRRPVWAPKTRCCSAALSRENRGRTSTPAAPRRRSRSLDDSRSRVSRMSRSDGMKTSTSPRVASASSRSQAATAPSV